MPEHTPAADRSKGGPGSSHEDGDKQSARTRKGDRTSTQTHTASGEPHGDAHGHHAEPDETTKANHKAEHGGKP